MSWLWVNSLDAPDDWMKRSRVRTENAVMFEWTSKSLQHGRAHIPDWGIKIALSEIGATSLVEIDWDWYKRNKVVINRV